MTQNVGQASGGRPVVILFDEMWTDFSIVDICCRRATAYLRMCRKKIEQRFKWCKYIFNTTNIFYLMNFTPPPAVSAASWNYLRQFLRSLNSNPFWDKMLKIDITYLWIKSVPLNFITYSYHVRPVTYAVILESELADQTRLNFWMLSELSARKY